MKKIFKKINLILLIIVTLTYYAMPFSLLGSKSYATESLIDIQEEPIKEDGKTVSNGYFEVKSSLDNTSRYKGILLANLMLEEKNEFKFKDTLNLNLKEKTEFSSFEISNDILVEKDSGEEVDVSDYTIYKALIIDKESFDKVFGKLGKIVILDSLGKEIATVDSTITPIDNEYKLNFVKGIKNISLVLYGIENVGELKFEFEMALKNLPFVREDIESFSKIKIKNIVDTVVASEEISEENALTTIVETASKETKYNSAIEIDDIFTQDTKSDANIEINDETTNKIKSENQNTKEENSNIIEKEEIETPSNEIIIEESDEESESKNTEVTVEDIEILNENTENVDTSKNENTENVDTSKNESAENIETSKNGSTENIETPKEEKQESKKVYKSVKEELVNEIVLESTKTQVDVSISDELFSTEKENNVTFTVSLKNDGEQYDLIQNPVIRMNLPDDVDSVEILNVSLINKNGLTLDSWRSDVDLTGKKYIELSLSGTEDLYNVSTVSETTITLETKITLNRLTTSKNSQIEIMYTNDLMTNLDYAPQSSFKSLPIKYVGREDLLRFYTVENFNDKNEKIEMFNEIKSTGNVEIAQSERDAKVNLSIVNNYGKDLENIRIIGKLPVVSNIDSKGYNLDNSFDMKLKSELILHGLSAKVYYTDREDISESSNEWKESLEEVSNVKAYKVVLDTDKMSQGEQLNISYDLSMPGNIDYNDKAYQEITIYYELNGAMIMDTSIIGLVAPEKEELNLDLINPEKKTVVSMTPEIITQEQVIDEIIGNVDKSITNIEEIQNIEKIDATQVSNEIIKDESSNEAEEHTTIDDIGEIKNEIEDDEDKPIEREVGSTSEGTFEVESGVYIDDEKVEKDADVRERQILKYVYVLKNNSDKELTDVKIDATVTNANMYYLFSKELVNESDGEMTDVTRLEEDKDGSHKVEKFTFDKILPGEVKEISFMAVVKPYIELQEKEVSSQVHITSKEIDGLKIESQKNKVVQGKIETFIRRASYEDVRYSTIYPDDTTKYEIYVKNISSDDLENVLINLNLNGRVIASTSVFSDYPNSTRSYSSGTEIVTFPIDRIKSGEEVDIFLDLITTTVPTDKDKGSFSAVVKVNVDEEEYISNKYSREVIQNQLKLVTTLASNKSITEKIWDGEKVTFTYTVKNESAINADFALYIFNGYGFVTESVKMSEPSNEIYNKEISVIDDVSEDLEMVPGSEMIFTIDVKFELSKATNKQKYVSSTYHLSNDEKDLKTMRYEIGWPEEKIEVEEPSEIPVEEEVTETKVENTNDKVITNTEENINVEENTDKEEIIYSEENNENEDVQDKVIVNNEENIVNTYVSDKTPSEEIKTENVVNEIIKVDKSNPTASVDSNVNQNKIQNEKITNVESIGNSDISQNSSIKTQIKSTKNKNGIFEYDITGRLWIDFDDNGKFDEDTEDETKENVVKNLYLYKVIDNQVDLSKPVRKISKLKNEKYKFAEVGQGEYVILAEYDSNNYKLAKYSDDDSVQNVLSQGIEKNINNVDYATSNKIEVSEGNVSNVNIGFTPKNKFDMKIETYLEEVDIKNPKDTSRIYFEEDNSLQKVEIRSKYINDTTITAQYTIEVTNEGNLPGYVTQIEDLIPEGWTFSEKANKNWKLGNDGKVYNSSLKDTEIKSGAVRYLSITLTLKTNEGNTGLHTNQVSIVKATNSKQVEDDNLPNNKAKVDLMVLISTGRVVNIIIIAMISILSLIAIYTYIRFFRNKNKTIKSMGMMILIAVLLVQINIIKSYAASYLLYGKYYSSPVTGYKERISAFATGSKSSDDDNIKYNSMYSRLLYGGSMDDTNSNYYKKSSYLANLYLKEKPGNHYKRKYFLGTRKNRGKAADDYTDFYHTGQTSVHASRTQFCLHSSDVDDYDDIVDGILSVVLIMDYGWNNGPVQHFVRAYGAAANNYASDYDDGTNYMSRYHCNQQMSYLLYRAEIGSAATKNGVSLNTTPFNTWDSNKYANNAYPKKDSRSALNGKYQIFSNYKKGVSFILYTSGLAGHHYNSTMLEDIDFCGDVDLSVSRGNALGFANDNERDLTAAGRSFRDFTLSAAQLRINEGSYPASNLNDEFVEDSILTDMGSNNYFRVRSANGDTTETVYGRTSYRLVKQNTADDATFKVTTSVQSGGKMRTCVEGNQPYINNIKIKYPLQGTDVYMNNHVHIQYKTISGNWVNYGGKVYARNAANALVGYDQTEYGINAANRSCFYNNELYIPIPYDIDKTSRGDVLKIVNTYNTYASRFMYITCDDMGQPQGVGRGARIIRESSVSYKFDSPDIRLSKSVVKVDGAPPQIVDGFPWVEQGCTILYKIGIQNMLMPVSNLRLFDGRDFASTLASTTVYSREDCSMQSGDWVINANNELTRVRNMPGDGYSDTIYLKYRVDEPSSPTIFKQLNNTIYLKSVSNVGGELFYTDSNNDGIPEIDKMMPTSVKRATASVKERKYRVNVVKALHSVSSTKEGNDFNDASNNRNESNKTKVYAESGDVVVFRVDVINAGETNGKWGIIDDITINDRYATTDYQFVSFKSWRSSDFVTSGTSEDWTLTNTSPGNLEFKYSGKNEERINVANSIKNVGVIEPDYFCRLYIKYRVLKKSKRNETLINSTKIVSVENHHDLNIISYTSNDSIKKSEDSVTLRIYSINTKKTVYRINKYSDALVCNDAENINAYYADGDPNATDPSTIRADDGRGPTLYAETGDIVQYKIQIDNTGSGDAYGHLYNIKLNDIYDPDELEFLSFRSAGIDPNTGRLYDFTKGNLSGVWSRTGDEFTYNGMLAKTGAIRLYIRFKVKKMSRTNDIITNTTNVKKVINRNSLNMIDYTNGKLTSFDRFTLRTYYAEVTKYISKVISKYSTATYAENYKKEITTEVGDKIVYTIKVKNSGTSKDLNGKLYQVDLTDYFDTNMLKYIVVNSSNGWNYVPGTSYVFRTMTGVDVGSTSVFTVTCENILRSTDDLKIINTAEIKNDNVVTNREGVNIRPVLNGSLKDDAEARYLTYHINFKKYISNRDNMTNQQKYDNPVIREKGNTVEYTLRLENTGETVIYTPTIMDILESGLENINSGTNGIQGKAYIVTKVNGISRRVEIASSGITVNSIDKQKMDIKLNNKANALKPGDVLYIVVKADVKKTNMYLWNLQNEANITSIFNKNDVEIINADPDIMNYDVYENKEYVRLDDLKTSGYVWEDANNDGVMDESESRLQNIAVNLIDKTNGKMTTAFTDENGYYSFSETNGYIYKIKNGEAVKTNELAKEKMVLSGGRVVKAKNREQKYGNYYSNTLYNEYTTNSLANRNLNYPDGKTQSDYIDYYIRFDYNGSKYRSTVYANESNLKLTDYSVKEAYHTDSNAVEYDNLRSKFKDSHEIINYNNSMNKNKGDSQPLHYDKQGHESYIIDDVTNENQNTSLRMSAYSFADGSKTITNSVETEGGINFLWLNENISQRDNDCYVGETEYLKEIGLGLKRQVVDLKLEKDLFEIKVTEKGEQSKYRFDQGNNATTSRIDDSYKGEYVTGGIEDEKNYNFKLYKSDYEYRSEQYEYEIVKSYMAHTELDLEVTYKITITNNSELGEISKDERRNVYGVVNEITDYYPVEFKKYDQNNNTKPIKLYDKTKGSDVTTNTLVENDYPIIEAWYGTDDLDEHKESAKHLTIKPNTVYRGVTNQNKEFDGYNKLYITGLQDIVLDRGESEDIYIKYTVDKNENNYVKLSNGNSVAEINSYSIYENRQKSKSLGYIDDNSNPGNVGYNKDGDYISKSGSKGVLVGKNIYDLYENDSYKTGIDFSVNNNINDRNSERVIKGFVWDDARSDSIKSGENLQAVQYVGNGVHDTAEAAKDARRNKNLINKNENAEKTDSYVEGVKVQLIELIEIGGKVYENDLSRQVGILKTSTNSNGEFAVSGFTPGKYIVRYTYGHGDEGLDGKKNMEIYNGQDYKSTTYNLTLDELEPNTYAVDSKDGDKVLAELTGKERGLDKKYTPASNTHKSDARDDEIIRLDSISYSEYVNNEKSNILQNGVSVENNNNKTKEILNKTSVYADTPAFPVRIEDETYLDHIKTYTFDDYNKIISNKRYSLENVDFGIQYRPEADMDIRNYITNINVTTDSGETIYDLNYDLYDVDGQKLYLTDDATIKRIGSTELNKASSKGKDNEKTIRNNYKNGLKGLIYLDMDAELLVGTKINISYITNVNNISEIDRYAKNLEELQYLSDAEISLSAPGSIPIGNLAYEEQTGYKDSTQYVATGTARNILYSKFIDGNVPRNDASLNALSRGTKVRKTNTVMKAKNYYGTYLGNAYYTGSGNGVGSVKYNNVDDVIATTKISGVLDYVDNDMTLDLSQNTESNNYLRNTSGDELVGRGMIEGYDVIENPGIDDLERLFTIIDNKGLEYNTKDDSRLALVVDDRTRKEDSDNDELKNKSITRFLKPENGYKDESSAYIFINTSKTLGVGDENSDLSFDNFAEIVGYRAETGRITTLQSTSNKSNLSKNKGITIGDINPKNISDSDLYEINNSEDKAGESDIDMAETVTLAPPTGRYKLNYYIKSHKGLIRITQTTLIAMIVLPIAYLSIKKFKTRKKFYK